jgi:murein DD-endopeptidase MepM/ murein hydrolase activator NlpD
MGYAWIALVPSWKAGLIFAILTLLQPVVGLAGLLGALCAWGSARLAGADAAERPVAVFNGLLCGLFIAHVWAVGGTVVALTMLSGVLCGWLSVVLGRLAWSLVGLPVLSLPFALVSMFNTAAGGSLSTLSFSPYVASTAYFGERTDAFFNAFSSLYFISNPIVGALVLMVMVAFSRYYLVLSVLGYVSAFVWMRWLGAAPEHLAGTAWDSNAILAALLVGGLFARPSLVTAGLATLAAVFAAWLALALGRILHTAQLVPYSVPFVMAAWLVLYAAVRNATMASHFNLHHPDFPERSFERARISQARVGTPGSVGLALPFMGGWTVSQGFSGQHTHRGLWRHALDFIVLREGKSFSHRGQRLEDFYCYNLPVLSPAYGQVWQVVNHVRDNAPGAVNTEENWGNFVIIRLSDGRFVMVAHLRCGSVVVHPGAWVQPGALLGHCGNSGRSPQPHIHMHLQTTAQPGSPTAPFHLASVMVTPTNASSRYELAVVPQQGDTLFAALQGDARPFYLFAGRGLQYQVERNGGSIRDWSVHCEVDLLGRLNLVSSVGARCVAESTWAVFSCYERNDIPDVNFDLWLLACGYTPVSTQVEQWEDRCVPSRLMPRRAAHWLASALWPMATFAHGRYRRAWDARAQGWRQQAQYRQKITGLLLEVEAVLVPQLGCTAIAGKVGTDHVKFQATRSFQRPDLGIPAWEAPLRLSAALAELLSPEH